MKKRQNSSTHFQSTSSCRYLLQIHLIFVVKYRKKLLYGNLNDDMLQKLFDISKKYDFEIKTMNSDNDHLHMLISMKPSVSVSQIVRVLKQESTIYIWKKYKQFLKSYFGKNILSGRMDILQQAQETLMRRLFRSTSLNKVMNDLMPIHGNY